MPDLAQVTVTDCGIPAATRFPSSLYPRMPWYVKAWDNKIWLANGNVSNASPNANSGSGMVSYNPATETSTNEYTNSDEQIFTFREINGQLWAGGGDKDGGGDNQWLYKYASGSWSKYEVLPFGYHAYDLCQIGSTIYAGGGTESTCVAKSTDNGATWTLINIPSESFCEYLHNVNGTLIASTNLKGNLGPSYNTPGLFPFVYNGSTFDLNSTNMMPGHTDEQAYMLRGEVLNGYWFYIVGHIRNQRQVKPLYAYRANLALSSTTEVTFDTGEVPYDLKKYGSTGYLLTSKPNGDGTYKTRIRTSTDATLWPVLFEFNTPSFGLSFDILNGKYYIALGTDFGPDVYSGPSSVSTDTGRLYEVTLPSLTPLTINPPTVWGRQSLVYSDNGVTIKEESGESQMRLGAQTHVAQGWNVNDTVRLLKDANLTVARDEHYWNGTEYSAGVYTFGGYSHPTVYAAQATPIDWIFTADFFNSLYDSGNTPYSNTGQTAFANYAAAVVNNYKQIKAVEVWNEINGGTWTTGTFASDKPGYYKTLCQKTYDAVKAVRPEVKVLGGATVYIAAPFWQALKDNGALAYMDACSIHPYDDIRQWEGRLAELRGIIGDKELWVTEFGGPNLTPGWYTKAVTILDSFDVHTAFLYLLHGDGTFPDWGLYDQYGNPRAVREAAKFMSSLLTNGLGRFRKVTMVDSGLHAYQRGDTWIIWGTGHPLTVSPGVAIRNASGEQIAPPATISTDPVVIEGVRMGENVVISASPVVTSLADDFYSSDWSFYARAISGGALTALSQVSTGYAYVKGLPGTYLTISQGEMHPEGAYDAQARYTAPRNIGACTASFSFQVSNGLSNGIVATILKNGTSVWSQTVTPTSVVSSTASLSLNSGDTVDIRVNGNGSISYDATSVTFSLST